MKCRLALHIMCFSNPKAVAVLWQRFVRHLREACWDTGRLLPRMAPPTPFSSGPHGGCEALTPGGGPDQDVRASGLARPDFSCCLLHQKLQMLNLCIHQAHKLQPLQAPEPGSLQVHSHGHTERSGHSPGVLNLLERTQSDCVAHALQVLFGSESTLCLYDVIAKQYSQGMGWATRLVVSCQESLRSFC